MSKIWTSKWKYLVRIQQQSTPRVQTFLTTTWLTFRIIHVAYTIEMHPRFDFLNPNSLSVRSFVAVELEVELERTPLVNNLIWSSNHEIHRVIIASEKIIKEWKVFRDFLSGWKFRHKTLNQVTCTPPVRLTSWFFDWRILSLTRRAHTELWRYRFYVGIQFMEILACLWNISVQRKVILCVNWNFGNVRSRNNFHCCVAKLAFWMKSTKNRIVSVCFLRSIFYSSQKLNHRYTFVREKCILPSFFYSLHISSYNFLLHLFFPLSC